MAILFYFKFIFNFRIPSWIWHWCPNLQGLLCLWNSFQDQVLCPWRVGPCCQNPVGLIRIENKVLPFRCTSGSRDNPVRSECTSRYWSWFRHVMVRQHEPNLHAKKHNLQGRFWAYWSLLWWGLRATLYQWTKPSQVCSREIGLLECLPKVDEWVLKPRIL